ncbi:MAG: flippase-like domain-containing protein [Caldilineaceae bacterium]
MRRSWLLWPLTIAFVWAVLTHIHDLEQLGHTVAGGKWQWLGAAIVLQLLYYVAYTAVYRYAFATVDVRSTVWELLPVTYASLFVNLAAPTGGAAGAALFVDEVARRGQSRTHATVGVLLMMVLDFGVLGLIVLVSLGVLAVMGDLKLYEVVAAIVLFLFVGIMAAALLGGLWRPHWLEAILAWLQARINWLGARFFRPQLLAAGWSARIAAEFTTAAQAMVTRPGALIGTMVVALVAHALNLLSLYSLFFAFQQPVSAGVLLVGYAMTILFTIVSPTPNGVGIVEGLMPVIYTSLGLPLPTATVISLVFRGITFWLPMLAGFLLLRRLRLFTLPERALAEREQPHFVAIATAAMGVINVLSGAVPSLADRVRLIAAYSPLEVRQGGHLTAVLAGFALLLLARGLWRRKVMAWRLTLFVLVLSVLVNLVKGLDYEEALLALVLAVSLWLQRSHFHALSDPPSFWQGVGVLAAAALFTLTYGVIGFYLLDRHFHVRYSFEAAVRQTLVMFTQFYDPGLQPLTGFGRYFAWSIYVIGATTLGYALIMLLRPVLLHRPAGLGDRRRAARIVQQHGRSSLARFTLFPDKFYFFSPGGSMVAYVAKGHIAIALGDPIGPQDDASAAIAAFQQFCARNDWKAVFYQTMPDYLEEYRAAGFETLCIGHEGIVALDAFSLSGGHNKNLRAITNRFLRAGYQAVVHEPPLAPALLTELSAVSDEWLTMVQGSEQRFSLGWFDEAYVGNSQVMAVHTPAGAISAFANFVPEYQRNEVGLDLMRRRCEVAPDTMEFLFVSFLHWAKERGYTSFNLGLSALSGVGEAGDDPALEQLLHYLYGHLNQFYNFKGLHDFKAKFHPEWSPRYLVYPHATALPAIFTALVRISAGDDFLFGYLNRRLKAE